MKREGSCPWSKSQQGAVPGSKLMGLKAGVPHPHLLQDPLVAHYTDRATARSEPSVASHESREVLALAQPLSAHLPLRIAFPSLTHSHLGAFSTCCSLCFIHASAHITPEEALRDLAPRFIFPHRTHLCLTTSGAFICLLLVCESKKAAWTWCLVHS